MQKNKNKSNNAIVLKRLNALTRVSSQIKTTEKILARIKKHSDKESEERKKYWIETFSSLYDQKKWDKLLASSNACIELFSEWNLCYNYRGIAKRHFGDYEGAIDDYNKAIELDSEYASAYFNRGFAKYRLEDNEGAIDDYTIAIELDSEDASAYSNRGVAKNALGDEQGAIEDKLKADELEKKQQEK